MKKQREQRQRAKRETRSPIRTHRSFNKSIPPRYNSQINDIPNTFSRKLRREDKNEKNKRREVNKTRQRSRKDERRIKKPAHQTVCEKGPLIA